MTNLASAEDDCERVIDGVCEWCYSLCIALGLTAADAVESGRECASATP